MICFLKLPVTAMNTNDSKMADSQRHSYCGATATLTSGAIELVRVPVTTHRTSATRQ